jgi:hypothetical protein
MAAHDMFFAMILTNAKRREARELELTVKQAQVRIDMLLPDGSSQPLVAPPLEVLAQIIASLEQGRRQFTSTAYDAAVEEVEIKHNGEDVAARISRWTVEHCE